MKNILHVQSSLLGTASSSLKLGHAIVARIREKYPEHQVQELDLVAMNIPHLSPAALPGMFMPEDQLTPEHKASNKLSDQLVAQVQAADIIVIGAPLINFTIHTSLKAWIDHITRPRITFGYGDDGRPVGLINGKKVYVAMSSGGVYSEGPGKENDFVAPYLKAFLGFLGMTDLTVFRAEGLKVPGVMETAMEKAIAVLELTTF